MLCDGFCYTIEYTLKIVKFTGVLYFDDDDVALTVLGFYVDTVEFVILRLLVSLAFKNLYNFNRLVKEYSQETFQNTKVGLLSEQSLDSPVKAYVSVSQFCHGRNLLIIIV